MFIFIPLAYLAGAAAAAFGTWRSTKQKVSHSHENEVAVVDIASRRPDLVLVGSGAGLKAECFADPGLARRFAEALASAEAASTDRYDKESAAQFSPADADSDAETFVAKGVKVIEDHHDRSSYVGALEVVRDGDHLVFAPRKTGYKRLLLGGLAAAVSSAVIYAMDFGPLSACALIALVFYSIAATITDHDTLLIDMPTFALGTSVGIFFVLAAVYTHEFPARFLILAGIAVAAWVAVFALVNVYAVVRKGTLGIGFGDSMMILTTTGIPTAITGNPNVAVWTVLASMLLALAHRGTATLLKLHSKDRPFALIPYLAVGWLAGLTLIYTVGGV